jgi:glycogen debranching enzyme
MTSRRTPFLHDAVIALRAPTQVWSRGNGSMTEPIDGLFHGDRRFLRGLAVEVEGDSPEPLAVNERGAHAVDFESVLRAVAGSWGDLEVGLTRTRTVEAGQMSESLTVVSAADRDIEATLRFRIEPDFCPLQVVRAGLGAPESWKADVNGREVTVTSGAASFKLETDAGAWRVEPEGLVLDWPFSVHAKQSTTLTWSVAMTDPRMVVQAAPPSADWAVSTEGVDRRLARWVETALGDLDGLRLALPDHPDDAFIAAGAPWFFTLFGRDSLWAARMLMPVDVSIAASTLRVLARLQGTRDDPETEEEPGKILHELRDAPLDTPGVDLKLPPLYYGTVDATALWVCLLVDAWRAGMPNGEVAALLPNLHAALAWIESAAGKDGFLSYIDRTGKGLSNQGWKDTGEAVQWRDGRLAEGPIALCEVQGYAHEAAAGAADLLEAFGEEGATEWRSWSARLRERFNERFWVTTAEGTYPAIALDRNGGAVDALTSNIGHLLGTGIIEPEAEARIAEILIGRTMNSGFGVRTLSTETAGYRPLNYHSGAVWAHDSAIIAYGMARIGRYEEAAVVVDGLLNTAEGFGFRMPELHSGHPRAERTRPVPYPGACRPQAWSAAAAITSLQIAQSCDPKAP